MIPETDGGRDERLDDAGRTWRLRPGVAVLHPLGLDSRRLGVPDQKRLDIDHGKPIREILA